MFWILEKSDAAILGHVRGEKSQRVMAGPFDSYEKAMEEKSYYRRWGCTWYAVVKSEAKPKSTKQEYEFTDAQYEFNDV